MYRDNHNNVLPIKITTRSFSFSIVIRDKLGMRHVIYPVIFTDFSLRKGERVQVVNGFKEAVHMYAFGKNADQLSLSGYVLASNLSNPSFAYLKNLLYVPYEKTLRAFSAAKTDPTYRATVSGPGGVLITGVATGLTLSMNSAINSVINFAMTFIAINSLMGVGKAETSKPVRTVGKVSFVPDEGSYEEPAEGDIVMNPEEE